MRLAILGSTGSIGTQTLKVVEHYPELFEVTALAAKSNVHLLIRQAKQFSPKYVCIYDAEHVGVLQKALPNTEILVGMPGLKEIAMLPEIDTVVSAIVGSIGIEPTYFAAKAGKRIALANKESLVAAGKLIMDAAQESKAEIIPVDSEHSALFQCLHDPARSTGFSRLILTASGGPFFKKDVNQLKHISPSDALKHPTWKMGKKVTIDSSTLMNKGLEMIEAHWLFGATLEQIDVVIHPQSIIHSMVEYADGSLLAQMSYPNMQLPIQYALTYPNRLDTHLKRFDLTRFCELEFYPLDSKKFKAIELAREAIRRGGSLPCFMNAANEVLVERFLKEEISWFDIVDLLEDLCQAHQVTHHLTLENIKEIDTEARRQAQNLEGVLS